MTNITYSGKVELLRGDPFDSILLVQSDGYKVDLVSRAVELCKNYGEEVSIEYFVSERPKTKAELDEALIRVISGDLEAEYTTESYRYSSWTSGVDYESTLKIGGHDLFSELREDEGKYLVITFKFKPISANPSKKDHE